MIKKLYYIPKLSDLDKYVDPSVASNAIQLVKNKTWHPEIIGEQQRLMAAFIHFTISGKASKKICIKRYLKTGFVPLFKNCRQKIASFGLLPQEFTAEERAYHDELNRRAEEKEQRKIAEEVEEECQEAKYNAWYDEKYGY
jgi:hypothetical protein